MKIVKGKEENLKMTGKKHGKMSRGFFSFVYHFLKPMSFSLVYQVEISTRIKHKIMLEKIKKSFFVTLKKIPPP